MSEHPIEQPIEGICIDDVREAYSVGQAGVTRIEACVKSGLHADLPYVRVWCGDEAVAEVLPT
jgi:hypothetical protein